MVRRPERLVLRLIALGGLVAGPLLILLRGSVAPATGRIALLAGSGAICVALAAFAYSFVAKEAPMAFVEVSSSELIRYHIRVPVLRIPLSSVKRLFVRKTRVVSVSARRVQRERDRYELHVEGHAPPPVDPAPEANEHALARGAILCGSLESIQKLGPEIAEACGASFDPVAPSASMASAEA